MQQLFTECLLLSRVATGAGLLVAWRTISLASKVSPAPLHAQSYTILDGPALIFDIGISILCALLFGVLPSLRTGRVHLFGTRGSISVCHSRLFRESLVAAQVMLTLVPLTASVSVTRAFLYLMEIDRGFDTKGLITR